MAMDDFGSSTGVGAGPDLDEDLFDFPPMEVAEPAPIAVEAAEEPAAPKEGATQPKAAAAPAAQSKGYTGMDAELDLDIFNFPVLEDDSVEATASIEASIDEAAQTVNDLLEDDLGEMIQDHHEELERKKEAEEVAKQPPVASTPAPSAPVQTAPAPVMAVPSVQTIPVAGLPTRVQWVLVGVASAFMLGLLLIAWQLTSAFSRSLERVRDDVAESTQALQVQNAEQIARIDELQAELLAQQALANQALQEGAAGTPPLARRTSSEITLLAAQSSIDSHDFTAARRMLFRDLANADTIPIEERDEMTQKMEFMIARSYLLESQVLAEEGR